MTPEKPLASSSGPSFVPDPDAIQISAIESPLRKTPSEKEELHPDEDPRSPAKWFCRSAELELPHGADYGSEKRAGTGPQEFPWGIHWETPFNMVFLLFISVGVAVAHHRYYSFLDGVTAGSRSHQQWVNRVGTGLAVLFRTTLAASVRFSRKQVLWSALRTRSVTLGQINALFGVSSSPLYLRHLGMMRIAGRATIMALALWSIALTTIFTPGAITVATGNITERIVNCTAPSVKYPFDDQTSAELIPQTALPMAQRLHGRYIGPSDSARQQFILAITNWASGYDLSITNCPTSAISCSYNFTAIIPGMNCSLEASYQSQKMLWDAPSEWLPLFPAPVNGLYPLVVVKRDPNNRHTLRVGLTDQPNYNDSTLRHTVIGCRNSIGKFNLSGFKGDRYLQIGKSDYTAKDEITFLDEVEAIKGKQSEKYETNDALFDTIVDYLEGSILVDEDFPFNATFEETQDHVVTNQTKIGALTGPFDNKPYDISPDWLIPVLNVLGMLMAMMPIFNNLSEASATVDTVCQIEEVFNVYTYDSKALIITYSSAAGITILMTLLGLHALHSNGVVSDDHFSTILLTTRNPKLDEVTKGACVGGTPLPEILRKTKLHFGEVGSTVSGSVGHTAFGVVGKEEIRPIVRGGRYS